MPKRSGVETMPRELRDWLDSELVRRGFRDYVQLAADLKAKGADVSKSTVHRYGSRLEERMAQWKASAEQARAIVAASGDDEGAMNEVLIRLTQDKLMNVLVEMEVDPEAIDLTKLTRAISDLVRGSVSQKRFAAEVRAKAAERLKAVEAEAKAMKGETRDVAMEMLQKVRAVYEGAL